MPSGVPRARHVPPGGPSTFYVRGAAHRHGMRTFRVPARRRSRNVGGIPNLDAEKNRESM